VFSSRKIEATTYTDVAVKYICGGIAHPDHSVISAFRKDNKAAFEEAFKRILVLAVEMKYLKKLGGISVDGTKLQANASKHSAVSYGYAVKMLEELEKEVKELTAKAEEADSIPLAEGLTIPEEIGRREERKAQLEVAKKVMEERYEEAKRGKEEAKRGKEEAEKEKKSEGKDRHKNKPKKSKSVGKEKPLEKYQYNFTDPESRIMKVGGGQHFEQSYNAQAAVDTEGSMLIVGGYVTDHGNDRLELVTIVGAVDEEVREVETVSADTGYFSEGAVKAVEKEGVNEEGKREREGPEVYCAVEKQSHHRSVQDLEQQAEPIEPAAEASEKEKMRHRLKSQKGKEVYDKRKETVEPVFGIIKSVMGFRHFMMRGLERVNTEWKLVTLAYDLKKLYNLSGGIGLRLTAN
jgi:hypothetical protein